MKKIIVNGDEMAVDDSIATLQQLIEFLKLDTNRFFIVERNREVVKKEDYLQTSVCDGDQFEIVHFVGGG